MLTSIELENFKAFGQRQRIPLRPITLLFGANSAGKSSVIQALLLLKQTVEEAQSPYDQLVPKGKLVNLATVTEMMFRHDKAGALTITVGLQEDLLHESPEHMGLSLPETRSSFTFGQDERVGWRMTSFGLLPLDSDTPLVRFTSLVSADIEDIRPWIDIGRFVPEPSAWNCLRLEEVTGDIPTWRKLWPTFEADLDAERNRLQLRLGLSGRARRRAIPRPLEERSKQYLTMLREYTIEAFVRHVVGRRDRFALVTRHFLPVAVGVIGPELGLSQLDLYGLPARALKEFLLACVRRGCELERSLRRMKHVGPTREPLRAVYEFSNTAGHDDVGRSGQNMPQFLFKDQKLVQRLNMWLDRLGVQYCIEVRKFGTPDEADVFSLRLIDKCTGVSVNAVNVGSGVSQILPIVTQSILEHGNLICLEEPEVSLHPALQAELGSFFVEAIDQSNPNQFLIETHSEHLILRLLRRIRETTAGTLREGAAPLRPEDVSVLYVARGERGSTVQRLRISEDGEFIDRWPGGFFEERAEELF